jgi:hypothetical protein
MPYDEPPVMWGALLKRHFAGRKERHIRDTRLGNGPGAVPADLSPGVSGGRLAPVESTCSIRTWGKKPGRYEIE